MAIDHRALVLLYQVHTRRETGSRKQMRIRRYRRCPSSLGILALLLLIACSLVSHLSLAVQQHAAANDTTASANNNNNNNDWQALDYYQLLGLRNATTPATDISQIDTTQIKKAYRKQAKQWHPDKLLRKEHVTVQQANDRFAAISQAYQVLTDESERHKYDAHLKQELYRKQQQDEREAYYEQQQQKRQQTQQARTNDKDSDNSGSAFSWNWTWDDFDMKDPLRMFEEFFYGSAEDDEDEDTLWWAQFENARQQQQGSFFNSDSAGSSSSPSYSTSSSSNSKNRRNHNHAQPNSVHEDEYIWVDPGSGREVLRILQTKEYAATDKNGNVYFTVTGQDFVEEWDRYQRTFVYLPLQSQPVLLEEGYREAPTREKRRSSGSGSQSQQQQQQSPAVLLPNESLTGEHRLQNSRFVAGLSATCDFWIADSFWNEISWQSDTHVPSLYSQRADCRLALQGPHVVLTGGYPEQLLWYSAGEDDGAEDSDWFMGGTKASYLARLDGDGNLAVYRQGKLTSPVWLAHLLTDEPRTRAARLGQALLQRLVGVIPSDDASTPVQSSRPAPVRLICVSATGPVGCIRILRPLVRWVRDVIHIVQMVVAKLDRFVEDILVNINQ